MPVRQDLRNVAIVAHVDHGTINGRPFFCTCGVGFDAFISMKFAEAGRPVPLRAARRGGRRLKEVVLGTIIYGTLGCVLFFGIFGNYAVYLNIVLH